MKASLPQLINPASLPWHLLPSLAPAGVAVALAGFAEAAAIARRVASDDGEEWDCNRELLSQGAANLAVAAFGGLPVAGSLSRTSLARTAGGTSQLAHAVTGIVVLAFLPAGAALLSWLPRAVLGGLVAAAMAPLMMPSPALLPNAPRTAASEWPRRDLALGWATAAATLAVRFALRARCCKLVCADDAATARSHRRRRAWSWVCRRGSPSPPRWLRGRPRTARCANKRAPWQRRGRSCAPP